MASSRPTLIFLDGLHCRWPDQTAAVADDWRQDIGANLVPSAACLWRGKTRIIRLELTVTVRTHTHAHWEDRRERLGYTRPYSCRLTAAQKLLRRLPRADSGYFPSIPQVHADAGEGITVVTGASRRHCSNAGFPVCSFVPRSPKVEFVWITRSKTKSSLNWD